ncbi:MAG: hypothetical protein Ct9H300mP4_07700 [Gammaproteobacteria bacterium]|nr:MAG: hypothetical protein Ct9H300mP4_07700 [Gammaproteobacteria bacterium]
MEQLYRSCAFNVYFKDGFVWREDNKGIRASSDAPDYGLGCQKGLRHSNNVWQTKNFIPLKRIGERGKANGKEFLGTKHVEVAEKFFGLNLNTDRNL